jgi:hypothetical protein
MEEFYPKAIFRNLYPIILYAVLLHLTWAVVLFLSDSAGNATAIHALLDLVPRYWAVAIYGGVGLIALYGMIKIRICLYCLLPQQFILMVSAVGAVYAMWTGHFADGVARSVPFIIADQVSGVLAALGHTYAIIAIAHNR